MIARAGLQAAVVSALIALTGVVPARAVDAETLKKDMLGQWELSTTERSKTCVVTLKADNSAQGLKLELQPECARNLPFTKAITGWSVRGLDIIRLQDASGAAVIDLTEVESGIWEGQRSGEGVYILQNVEAAQSLARTMDTLVGDWSLVRGRGRRICGLTLTNTESSPDNFDVYLKPRCDPAVVSFAPKSWRLERGELRLTGKAGDAWNFEADDNAQWRLVPEGPEPLLLVR